MSTAFARFVCPAKFLLLVATAALFSFPATAQQPPPAPAPDPGSADPNLFYGATPADGQQAPVFVFIHGLRGTARDWWAGNSMYQMMYAAGFRTAFIGLNRDNSPNDATITANAEVIRALAPKVAARFGVRKVTFVTHSKGGLDLQAALLDPGIRDLARGIFMIACPNQGTELADWAFGPGSVLAGQLGLLTPGINAVRTATVAALRAQVDPVIRAARIPVYTWAGNTFQGTVLTGGFVTEITGKILAGLTGGIPNDGLVTVERTKLDAQIGIDLGTVDGNHYRTVQGNLSFRYIELMSAALDEVTAFKLQRVAAAGLGDPANSWNWSMAWFKGKLYAGSGRDVNCATFAAAEVQTGDPVYPPTLGDCPPDPDDLRLAAEIWQFTPELKNVPVDPADASRKFGWKRVYKAPENIPIEWDASGRPTKFTARDVGYRGMLVFRETDGSEALYVGGVTSSSWNDFHPQYQNGSFPPPRILRTTDGVNWNPLPQSPGTFLGDVYKTSPAEFRVRGFRSLVQWGSVLVATASDYRGVGVIVASANPSAGDNAWRQVSPALSILPTWQLAVYRNRLYAVGGDRRTPTGYAVWRTDGAPAAGGMWKFVTVVTNGAYAPALYRSPNGLSAKEFQGRLYVGTDRPTELIRINPDESWDLVVGEPRQLPSGVWKYPLSGIGTYFGNTSNGHFWRMADYDGSLFLGTWDWSVNFRSVGLLDSWFRPQYGSDLFQTNDGVYWKQVGRNGYGNPFNYGTRQLENTPFGLFIGTGKGEGGFDIFQNLSRLDLNKDGAVDQADVSLLLASSGQSSTGPLDPRDLNRDGTITSADATLLASQCNAPGCAITPQQPSLPAPGRVNAVPKQISGENAILSWDSVPGAARYRVYRSAVQGLTSFLPPNLVLPNPAGGFVTVPQIVAGALDVPCAPLPDNAVCIIAEFIKTIGGLDQAFGWPSEPRQIATVMTNTYREVAPSKFQSIYWVRAEDASGRLSDSSNIVGAPSKGDPVTAARVRTAIADMTASGALNSATAASLLTEVAALSEGRKRSPAVLTDAVRGAGAERLARSEDSDYVLNDLRSMMDLLERYAYLAEQGMIPRAAVLQ